MPLRWSCRWRRCGLMHDRRRRRLWMHGRRLRRRRVLMLLLTLWRRVGLRRRRVLPLRLRSRGRNVIIRTPYRLGRWLMVVTGTIKVASAIACVPSGLLLHHLRSTVAVDSSVIVIDARLGLRWRRVSPRHSRHIVIGQHASIASVSIGTADVAVIIAVAITNPASNGPSSPSARSTVSDGCPRMISPRPAINDTTISRRNRRMESRRRVRQPRPAVPSVPAPRRPAPSASVHKHPLTVTVWHPSPRV